MTDFRFRKTMLRVKDLDKSIKFYTGILGMVLLRQRDYEAAKFTNAFVGYGDEATHPVLELTHNWGRSENYVLGEGFGFLGIDVPDVYAVCDRLEKQGVNITRRPGPMRGSDSVIAFIEDPDGYRIELIQMKDT